MPIKALQKSLIELRSFHSRFLFRANKGCSLPELAHTIQTQAVEWTPKLLSSPKAPSDTYLVCDNSGRVLHSSKSLHAFLGIPVDFEITAGSLLDAAAAASPSGKDALHALARNLEQVQTHASPPGVNPPQRTYTAFVSELGENCWLAGFRHSRENDRIVEREHAGALRDHLTGVGNRRFLESRVDAALAKLTEGEQETACLLFIDLDRFKAVNDTLGHAVGDALLRLVSDRLTHSLREGDALGRLGGDEFAILLTGPVTRDAAAALSARIIDLLQRPYLVDGHIVNVGASIGLAIAPSDGQTRSELLSSADLALYHSKASGRGTYHFFRPEMQERAQRRRALELDLRKALLLRQFELHYQPQIDVETEAVIGLEALLRWRHPVRGLLAPSDFLQLAGDLGLAVPIGDWVLKTACREAMRWPSHVTIAVNISPLQFDTGKFAQSVERALSGSGLAGPRLEVEVTEAILLRDSHTVLVTLQQLRALGVRVAMDSFGTGVASLSQLVNFPFDKIKIDRSLIAVEQPDGRNRAIVRAISTLGHSLGISTLAEGVETAEHLAHVRSQGCHSVQGFFYSKAIPASELAVSLPGLFYPTPCLPKPAGGAA